MSADKVNELDARSKGSNPREMNGKYTLQVPIVIDGLPWPMSYSEVYGELNSHGRVSGQSRTTVAIQRKNGTKHSSFFMSRGETMALIKLYVPRCP